MKKVILFMAVAFVICMTNTSHAAWQPTKDIELVNPNASGGGSDLNARTIAEIAKLKKLCPTTIMANSRPGGSGAVGFSYVAAKKGDNHTLLILHNGQDIGSYVLNWDVKAKDLTYIATVAQDALMICALTDSRFTDAKTTIDISKKERVTWAGSSRGSADQLTMLMTNDQAGANFQYVMFASSGECVAALLGKHVDLAVLNPSEAIGQVRAGKVKALATFSPTREGGDFANVPTFVELGYPNLVDVDSRSVAGPADMSPEAVAFYEDMLKKITETEEWQKNYIDRNFLRPFYQGSKDAREKQMRETADAVKRFKDAEESTKK